MGKNMLASHWDRSMFSREGNEGGGGGNTGSDQQGQDNQQGQNNQQGQKEFKPPASQEEFDRIIGERVARERAKYPQNWEEVVQKAGQWETLERESQPERERAIREAVERAAAEERAKVLPLAVRQAFRAEAKGVLTDDQVTSLLEDLDLAKYVSANGDVDEGKVAKKIKAFAPADGGRGQNGGGRGPGFGQGSGHEQSTKSKGEGGLAEARRRFPEVFASTKS